MNRMEIAEVFERIAVLLDLRGENPFKIRAYQSGARLLSSMPEDEYRAHLAADDWDFVRGLGEALTGKLRTLHATGKLEFLEKLEASVPPGLVELTEIPGLGPKKARALHEKLGIASIPALRAACEEGAVASLEGFGEKTQAKILTGIERREMYSRRHLWWSAAQVATPLLLELRKLPGVRRADVAGSLRRGMETVADIDFIASVEDPAPVTEWFCTLPGIIEVTGRGETKCSVRLDTGMQADLRIVPDAHYGFALHHFTGSKEHNILMRQRALARGWSLSEWGLTPTGIEGATPAQGPAAASEEELFRHLGLPFIQPELREGLGEIEAAEAGVLPRVLELRQLHGAFHNHTTESDGHNTLEEMAEKARSLGWQYLGIADHSKSSRQAHGLDEARLAAQVAAIRRWNSANPEGLQLLAGSECDILPDGSLDWDEATRATLDYMVVSIHSNFSQDEETMTRRIIRALEQPRVTMLGHLTGRLLLRRDSYAVDIARVIDAALANHVVIELNANPARLDMDWRHWRRAAERGLLCAINPDAHNADGLGLLSAGVKVARKGWLEPRHVVNTLTLAELRTRLREGKIL